MEYFKNKTLTLYIWLAIFTWPLLHYIISPANQAILTFIAFTSDSVVHLNKNRIMVYSEYKIVNTNPNHVISARVHCWLILVILCRLGNLWSTWVLVMTLHKFSPLITLEPKIHIVLIYICIVLNILFHGIYRRCYKKWIIQYEPVSTYDAELPFSTGKGDD